MAHHSASSTTHDRTYTVRLDVGDLIGDVLTVAIPADSFFSQHKSPCVMQMTNIVFSAANMNGARAGYDGLRTNIVSVFADLPSYDSNYGSNDPSIIYPQWNVNLGLQDTTTFRVNPRNRTRDVQITLKTVDFDLSTLGVHYFLATFQMHNITEAKPAWPMNLQHHSGAVPLRSPMEDTHYDPENPPEFITAFQSRRGGK